MHTRQSSTQSDKYQVSHRYNYFSWWWAHSCPKHVEKRNKAYREKLCTNLSLFARLLEELSEVEVTPWCIVLVQKLKVPQVVENFPEFYRIRKFMPVFTKARNLSQFWSRLIFVFVILSSTIRTPVCFTSFRVILNILFPHVHEPCASLFISLDFITLSAIEEQRRLSGFHKAFYSRSPSGSLEITSRDSSVAGSAFVFWLH